MVRLSCCDGDCGFGDCNLNCEDCDFMNDAYGACLGSFANNGAGCKWANDTTTSGYCVDVTRRFVILIVSHVMM